MTDDRYEIIRKVLDAFDEMDRLAYENRILRSRLETFESGVPEEVVELGDMDRHVLDAGRNAVLDKSLTYWKEVEVYTDEDGEPVVEGFEKWRKRVVERAKLPDWCSVEGFYGYFDTELRDLYAKRRLERIGEE